MRKLLIGSKNISEKEERKIHAEFLNEFGVDLSSKKYTNGNFENNWNLILQDCTIGSLRGSFPELIHLFKKKLFDAININELRSCSDSYIVRTKEKEMELQEQKISVLEDLIGEYTALIDDYYMYEADVWLNAWFVIQSEKAECERLRKDRGSTSRSMNSYKPITWAVDTATGYVHDKSGREYRLPFEDDADGFFFGEYLKYVLSNTGALFWTELNEDEKNNIRRVSGEKILNFKGYAYRTDILLLRDKDYSRFGYRHIEKIEKSADFKIEDIILFHKTINGVLLRNMINTMVDCKVVFEAEDYLFLIDELCGCKSFVWQNLIGCLFILFRAYQEKMSVYEIDENMYMMLCEWLSEINNINYKLRVLTEGFLYLYHGSITEERIIEEKCKEHLKKLGLEKSRDVVEDGERESDKLRITSEIKMNHRSYKWIYAILQREVINKTKSLYRDEGFQEKVCRIDLEIPYKDQPGEVVIKNIVVKRRNFKPDINNAVEMLRKRQLRIKLTRILARFAQKTNEMNYK